MATDIEGVERADDDEIQTLVLVHQSDEARRGDPFWLPSEKTKSQL